MPLLAHYRKMYASPAQAAIEVDVKRQSKEPQSYAYGVGLRLVGSLPLPAREQLGVSLVEADALDQIFDAKVGERLNTVFADAIRFKSGRLRSPFR